MLSHTKEFTMQKSFFVTLFLVLFMGVNNSSAAVSSWEFDKVHSNFYFSVDHVFSKVHGNFREFSGTILFDPENLAESSFLFDIKVESINTDNGKRDKHLLSADFLEEGKYPTISFASETITATGKDSYTVQGKFTIKGKEYDLSFPLSFAGIKDHPAMEGMLVAGFNGTLTLDRLAYGVGTGKFLDMGVVGKDVDILISLEVVRKK
jgi:polyisoprenoid-binding protein YceI